MEEIGMGLCDTFVQMIKAEGKGKPLPASLTVDIRNGQMTLNADEPYDIDLVAAELAKLGITITREQYHLCG